MFEALQKLVPWLGTLTTTPKVLLSLVVLGISGFVLAVVWVPQPHLVDPQNDQIAHGPVWPSEKSMDALKRKIDRVSETNAKLLKIIATAGSYGVYVGELASKASISREVTMYRLRELEKDGLVELLPLTDLNARLHEDLTKVLGVDAANFVNAYLK